MKKLTVRTRESIGRFGITWRLAPPRDPESCRWQSADGRWVALALGGGAELGVVVVTDSSGRRETVESYEEGLALARVWRS